MAASNEWFEYHLTPQGWVQGAEKIDFSGINERTVPENRVKTIRYHEYMSSGFSQLERWIETTYAADSDRVAELEEQFGDVPPKHSNVERR